MPKSEFAGPGKSFPVNDLKHARLAIPMATKSMRAGNISASTAAHIKARARAKLHHSDNPGSHFPMTTHKRTRSHGSMDWNIRG